MPENAATPDLRTLESEFEIRGELRGTDATRYYIGRTRGETPAEVAIMVIPAGKGGENNALSHYAADAQILGRNEHPTLARVLGGKWIGSDSFAMVSERILGESLDERLERGEKFTNPRIAMLLQEVSGVLDWAREQGVVHRGVTPETMFFERGTNRLRISLAPTPIPLTGIPDACSDARTLGTLAWAFLTGEPYKTGETRSLGEVCPNLATRVVDATDRMVRCKDHAEAPDVGTFLGIIAAGDVMKQAEVELAAQKEEYDEQHEAALQACEVKREEVEQHAAEQASILAGEREEFQRQMADDRAALEAERAQNEAIMNERKERLAAVRSELDAQRVELERRLKELEDYRAEVERLRDEALSARESAKQAAAKAAEAAAAHAAAVKAAQAEAAERMKNAAPVIANVERDATEQPIADLPPAVAAAPIVVPELEPMPAPKLAKPPKPPKWKKFEPVDLEHTDNVTVEDIQPGRPRWMIPAGVATLAIILVAVIYGVMHRAPKVSDTIRLGNSTVVPTPPSAQSGIVPRGGFLTQSAGGSVAPKFTGSPLTPADSANAAAQAAAATTAPSDGNASNPDSVAARARRAAAREEARRRAQQSDEDLLLPPGTSNTRPRAVAPPPDRTEPSTQIPGSSNPSAQLPTTPIPATPPIVTTPRRDTTAGRRDSVVAPPPPKPDTTKIRR